MALVDIFMSTYNRAHLVRDAVYSILNQILGDWSLTIIDDCSQDRTWEVLQKYKDKRIRLVRNDVNLYSVPSKNPYMLDSQAKYLAILDDDDKWEPEYLHKLVNELGSHPDCSVAYCDAWREDFTGGRKYWDSSKGKPFPNILPSCSIYRVSTFKELGGWDAKNFPGYHAEADYYFRVGWPNGFVHIPKPLVILGPLAGAMSSDKLECALKELKLIEKHKDNLSNKVISELYARVGLHMIESGNSKLAHLYFRKAVLNYFFNFEAWGGLILNTINRNLFLLVYKLYRKVLGYA